MRKQGSEGGGEGTYCKVVGQEALLLQASNDLPDEVSHALSSLP